jgi:hypothetical protein
MTPNEIIITIIIFAIILVVSLFAVGLCRMLGRDVPHSDCSYSDPDKRIGHDGEDPEWK